MPRDPYRVVLDPELAFRLFRLGRQEPHATLMPWIEAYWEVIWDLPEGTVHHQTILAHAAIHVVVEQEAWLYGVPGPAFVREITGTGRVFGVKFHPGAFWSWRKIKLKSLYNKRVPLVSEWDDAESWSRAVLAEDSFAERVRLTDEYLMARPHEPPGDGLRCATSLIEGGLLRVEDWCAALGYDIRGLQRLFHREVGVGPKEVLRRYRLIEAADRLHKEPGLSGTALAAALGYADQAHFIRDFRAVIGVTPEAYRRGGLSGGALGGTPEQQENS